MIIKSKELALSLVEGGGIGKLPGGVFPEIQEKLNGLAAGSACKPCSEYCHQNKKMERVNQIFGVSSFNMFVDWGGDGGGDKRIIGDY